MTDVMFMWPQWLIGCLWCFLLISYTLLYRLLLHISTRPFFFSFSFFIHSLSSLFINRFTQPPSLPCVFVAERRALHDDTAGRDAAWHRRRDEVSVRHELCSPRPRRPEYPGQQQLGLQGLWLWPVTLSGRHLRRPHLHKLPGQYYVCVSACESVANSALCLYSLRMFNWAC